MGLLSRDKVQIIKRQRSSNFFRQILSASTQFDRAEHGLSEYVQIIDFRSQNDGENLIETIRCLRFLQILVKIAKLYLHSLQLRLHPNLLWSDTKMISSLSSINPESFSRFGEGHVYGGTFPMDSPLAFVCELSINRLVLKIEGKTKRSRFSYIILFRS